MIEVLVNGANGKMGQTVCKILEKTEDCTIKYGIDKEDTGIETFPIYTDINNIPEVPSVIIDFSVPVATFKILEYAKLNKVPVVIATTGFSAAEEEKITEYSKYIPIFKSANMSVEVNMMKNLLKQIAPKLKDTDIEIIETHHNRKIDSPSGTAQMFANTINESLNNEYHFEYNRHEKHEKRDKKEIGISSIRGGNIVGDHVVQFIGNYETFEIRHTSYSRDLYAEGAVKAAKYIVGKDNGLYNMDDLIK